MNVNNTSKVEVRSLIYSVRGMQVILDSDLAALYDVETKYLKRQVNRNIDRFPEDFMLRLTIDEANEISRSQNVTLKQGQNIKYQPYAFTEQGISMLAGILNSKIAVEINIKIIRTFVELRKQNIEASAQEIIKARIRALEAGADEIKTNILVTEAMISAKTSHTGREILKLREELAAIKDTLNQFSNAHIIIKRPEDTSNLG